MLWRIGTLDVNVVENWNILDKNFRILPLKREKRNGLGDVVR